MEGREWGGRGRMQKVRKRGEGVEKLNIQKPKEVRREGLRREGVGDGKETKTESREGTKEVVKAG